MSRTGRLRVVVDGRNVAEVAFASGVIPFVFVHHGDLQWNLSPAEAEALGDALRTAATDARQQP